MSNRRRSAPADRRINGITLSTELDPRLPVVRVPGLSDAGVALLELWRPTLLRGADFAPRFLTRIDPRDLSLPSLLDAAEALRANLSRVCVAFLQLSPVDPSTTALVLAGTHPFPRWPDSIAGHPALSLWWAVVSEGRFADESLLNRAYQELLCERLSRWLWLEFRARLDKRPVHAVLFALWHGRDPRPQEEQRFLRWLRRGYSGGTLSAEPRGERQDISEREISETKQATYLGALEAIRPLQTAGADPFRLAAEGHFDNVARELKNGLRRLHYGRRREKRRRDDRDPDALSPDDLQATVRPPVLTPVEYGEVGEAQRQSLAEWETYLDTVEAEAGERAGEPGRAILRIIRENPNRPAKDLARAAGMSRRQLFRVLRNLHPQTLPQLQHLAAHDPTPSPDDVLSGRRPAKRVTPPPDSDDAP